MNIEYEKEQHYLERNWTVIASGDTDSELGKALARVDHDSPGNREQIMIFV